MPRARLAIHLSTSSSTQATTCVLTWTRGGKSPSFSFRQMVTPESPVRAQTSAFLRRRMGWTPRCKRGHPVTAVYARFNPTAPTLCSPKRTQQIQKYQCPDSKRVGKKHSKRVLSVDSGPAKSVGRLLWITHALAFTSGTTFVGVGSTIKRSRADHCVKASI